jgi:pimeloyl-ACP methyl ester carboxylesterase
MARHGFDVSIMPYVGHLLMVEQPERFNELLAEALSTI